MKIVGGPIIIEFHPIIQFDENYNSVLKEKDVHIVKAKVEFINLKACITNVDQFLRFRSTTKITRGRYNFQVGNIHFKGLMIAGFSLIHEGPYMFEYYSTNYLFAIEH